MAEVGASGEDVDLWLDTELFLDVQLKSGEWVVGETRQVNGRWILVEFQTAAVPPEWINVDQDTDRLAELHSRSGAEAQAREAQQVAMRMERQSSGGGGGDAAAAGSSVAAAAGQAALPAASAHLLSQASAQNLFDAKTAREAYVEVLSRCEKEIQAMIATNGDRWLQRLAEERLTGRANGTKPITKSQSCYTPAAAAAASSSSAAAAAAGSSHMDDVSAPDSLSVSALIVRFPLFDSMTRTRMMVPVRAESCSHPESFDLWSHICHRIESSNHAVHSNPLWTCPQCKKEAWAPDLHVDPLMMHVIRCIEDGRMEAHLKQQASLTPASALMSAASLQASLSSFASLISSPPVWGASSSSQFEERRLTMSIGGAGHVSLTLATEADDASRVEARKRMNRARTMPTPTAEKRKSFLEDEYQPGSSPAPAAASSNGSAAKKQRTSIGPYPLDLGSDDEDMDAANGHAAAAAAPSSSSSAAAAASSSSSSAAAASSFSSSCPWPSWTDDAGCFWIDVREGPADIEDPARWASLRVKTEKAHAAYAAIQKQQQAAFAPPPMPVAVVMPMQLAQMQPAQLAALSAALQAQGSSAADSFSASYNRVSAAARSGSAQPTYPGAPPFHRAATSPAAAASASPPLKRRKKPQRAESVVAPKAAGAPAAAASKAPALSRLASSPSSSSASPSPPVARAASSSSAAAAAPSSSLAAAAGHSLPLVNVNTCTVWDLQQVDGVGPKMAAKIVQAREQKWFVKKIKWNDRIIDKRNKDKQEAAAAAAATAGAASLPPSAAASPRVSAADGECECEAAEWCAHVKAFKSLKSLKTIEGVGTKLFNKFEARLTV